MTAIAAGTATVAVKSTENDVQATATVNVTEPTNNYWRKREEKHIRENQMNDARIAKRLAEKHEEAMQEIQKEIEAFYGR